MRNPFRTFSLTVITQILFGCGWGIEIDFRISCLDDCEIVLHRYASPKCKDVLLSAIINSVYCIWQSCNSVKFQEKCIP